MGLRGTLTACAAAPLLAAALVAAPAAAAPTAGDPREAAPAAAAAAPAKPAGAQDAVAAPGEAGSRAPQAPVRISADAAEYFNAEGLVVFTGKVIATQAETTLTAERMEVRFTEAPVPPGQKPGSLADPQAGRRISSIVATKSVTLRRVDPESGKERYATGEKGVYDAETRLMTLTGSPRLWENKNLVVGEEMVFRLDDRNVVVRGKVNLTVYPDDAKGAPPPR